MLIKNCVYVEILAGKGVDTGRGNMKIKGAMGKKKKTIRLFKTKVISIVLKP